MEYTLGNTLIEGKNISLELGGKLIHRDLNFQIKDILRPGYTQGQVLGILGPSGIGKTQLFKMISGIRTPTSGEVLINGQPVKKGQVGVVAQNYPLFKHMSVKANLELAYRHHIKDGSTDKVTEWLERFSLLDSKDKYPAELSGGMRQRVAIAQQLLCSEHFLLLDEPFSGLDHLNLMKVTDTLLQVANADDLNTLIVVTHDVSAATLISDHLWLLGFEKDEKGERIPGARILQEINLIDEGLAWQPDIEKTEKYLTFVRDIKALFKELV